jgi:hypothetical protein
LGSKRDLPVGPAEQSGEPPLALDQRQVAQVVVVVMFLGKINCGLSAPPSPTADFGP